MKTLIVGLGNTILSDDGAGVFVARMLRKDLAGVADIIEAETAGLDLMEMLSGYERAILVDAINLDGELPGTVFRLRPDDLKITPRLSSSHDIDIVTALALGRRLGFEMPDDVIIYAVQVEDMLTLSEGCLEAVDRVLPLLAGEIVSLVKDEAMDRISIDLVERRSGNA